MPRPAPYLQDEEDEDKVPFVGDPDEEDGTFDTGSVDDAGPPPIVPARPTTTVTPEMQAILRSPRANPNEAYEVQQANKARSALAEAKSHVPVPAQPKWWQRVGAGLAGAAAGYMNATGRTRPVDASPAVEGIMGGGKYQHDLAQYRANVAGAQAQSDAATATEGQWWKNRQLASQEELHEAQAEQAQEHGAYWRHRAEMEQNQWKVDPKTGSLFNTVTGEVHQRAASVADRIKDLQSAGYTPEEAKIVASGGHLAAEKPVAPPKQRNLVNVAPGHTVFDPETGKSVYTAPDKVKAGKGAGGQKPPSPAMMRGVEAKKNDRLNGVEVAAKRAIAKINSSPVIGPNGQQVVDPTQVAAERQRQTQAVYAELEQTKQQVQNEYEGEITASTGNYPGHFDYAQQKPAPPAAVPAPVAAAHAPPAEAPAGPAAPAPAAASAPAPSQVAEGTVVRNHKTGERRVLKGGQWVKL
jgi:hypothetical protein